MRTARSLRAAGLLFVLLAVTAGCGKKGPPLVPFSRVPSLITAVTPQRIGDEVYLSFKVPDDQRGRPEARRHRRG